MNLKLQQLQPPLQLQQMALLIQQGETNMEISTLIDICSASLAINIVLLAGLIYHAKKEKTKMKLLPTILYTLLLVIVINILDIYVIKRYLVKNLNYQEPVKQEILNKTSTITTTITISPTGVTAL